MRKNPTMDEIKLKAKQGYFWEYDLKTWFHYSQVDTKEKARHLLKIGNPVRVIKLAQGSCKAVAPRLKGFWLWIYDHIIVCSIILILIVMIASALPTICGSSFEEFYNGNTIISFVILAMLLFPITIFIILALKIRHLDLEDASYILFLQAEALKKGFIYDELGHMHSFQK